MKTNPALQRLRKVEAERRALKETKGTVFSKLKDKAVKLAEAPVLKLYAFWDRDCVVIKPPSPEPPKPLIHEIAFLPPAEQKRLKALHDAWIAAIELRKYEEHMTQIWEPVRKARQVWEDAKAAFELANPGLKFCLEQKKIFGNGRVFVPTVIDKYAWALNYNVTPDPSIAVEITPSSPVAGVLSSPVPEAPSSPAAEILPTPKVVSVPARVVTVKAAKVEPKAEVTPSPAAPVKAAKVEAKAEVVEAQKPAEPPVMATAPVVVTPVKVQAPRSNKSLRNVKYVLVNGKLTLTY